MKRQRKGIDLGCRWRGRVLSLTNAVHERDDQHLSLNPPRTRSLWSGIGNVHGRTLLPVAWWSSANPMIPVLPPSPQAQAPQSTYRPLKAPSATHVDPRFLASFKEGRDGGVA